MGRKKKCAKQVHNSGLQEAVLVKKPFRRMWLLGICEEWWLQTQSSSGTSLCDESPAAWTGIDCANLLRVALSF